MLQIKRKSQVKKKKHKNKTKKTPNQNQPKNPPIKPTTNEKKQGKNEKRNAHSSNPEGCGGTSMHTKVKKILFNILVGNEKIQLPY